jgi:hypothetical protein
MTLSTSLIESLVTRRNNVPRLSADTLSFTFAGCAKAAPVRFISRIFLPISASNDSSMSVVPIALLMTHSPVTDPRSWAPDVKDWFCLFVICLIFVWFLFVICLIFAWET